MESCQRDRQTDWKTDRQTRAPKRECLCLVCAAVLGGPEVTSQTPKASSSSLSPDTLTLTKLGAAPNWLIAKQQRNTICIWILISDFDVVFLFFFLECNWNCQFAFNSAKINCRLTHDLAAGRAIFDLNETTRLRLIFKILQYIEITHIWQFRITSSHQPADSKFNLIVLLLMRAIWVCIFIDANLECRSLIIIIGISLELTSAVALHKTSRIMQLITSQATSGLHCLAPPGN